LLCHRTDREFWNFPGGGIEPNETPADAAIREAKEEIGVQIEIIRLLGVYTKPKNNDIVFTFLAKITNGLPTLSNEADDVRYFSIDKLPPNINPFQVERIHDAMKNSREIFFKKQIDSTISAKTKAN
jgi:ADP-ribose pyrophosphatase YjhB (NUDIX family)